MVPRLEQSIDSGEVELILTLLLNWF